MLSPLSNDVEYTGIWVFNESNGHIQKKECRPDRSVSNNQFSSMTMIELAM